MPEIGPGPTPGMSAVDPLGTLMDWEQGRRDPAGPAKVLLQVIRKGPAHVLKALPEADA